MRSAKSGYSYGRKRDIFYSRTDMKRHFYFCGPPRTVMAALRRYFFPLQNSSSLFFSSYYGVVSVPHSCRVYGGVYATYNMDIAHAFKEFLSRSLPLPSRCRLSSSNFPYSAPNRLARLSESRNVRTRLLARSPTSLCESSILHSNIPP